MRFVLLLGALCLTLLISFARADDSSCKEPVKPSRYSGPLFDAMAQIESDKHDAVVSALKDTGIYRMALFARQHRKRNGEATVLALKREFPEQIVMGTAKPFSEREDLSDEFLKRIETCLKDPRYQFIGEIMFAHADKSHGEQTLEGERYVAAGGKNVYRLLAAVEKKGVPVMVHWEVYNWERDAPQFRALLSAFPKVTFIWPHAGFASSEQVDQVLSSYPNMVVTLSKKESDQRALSSAEKEEVLGGGIVDECGNLLPDWRALIEKCPDRFMFATDAHKDFRWKKYNKIVERWRMILGQLPDRTAQMLAWRNAERVYGPPRP